MQFKNTTPLSDRFFRRMLSWIATLYCYPIRELKSANFGKCNTNIWSHARGGRFGLQWKINFDYNSFPSTHTYAGRKAELGWPVITCNDIDEIIVMLTAHELHHVVQMHERRGINEKETERETKWVLEEFKKCKEELLAHWKEPVKEKIVDIKTVRANKANADLKKWQRKLKLAKTKVALYQKKVNYYDKLDIKNEVEE